MNARESAEFSLEWWEDALPARRAAVLADPTNRDRLHELAIAEQMRERAYASASAAFDREQEAEYAAQWASWAYGPDVNG